MTFSRVSLEAADSSYGS